MSSRIINIMSSSSELEDEKKRKRMISNRESARRSRIKKEQHMMGLNDQVSYLRTRRDEILRKIREIGPRYEAMDSENNALRMQGEELRNRLELLQQVLVSSCNGSTCSYVCDDVGNSSNNNNNMDHELNVMELFQEPWLQSCFEQQSQEYC